MGDTNNVKGNGHAGNGNGHAHVPDDYATTLANDGIGNLTDNAGQSSRRSSKPGTGSKTMPDELDTFLFGVNSERIAALELLYEYLEDRRPVKEVLEEIMQKIRNRLNDSQH